MTSAASAIITAAFKEFIHPYRIEKGNSLFTHTLIAGHGLPGGSFYFPDGESRQLLNEHIKRLVFDNEQPLSLTERPSELSPLRIDVDLRFSTSSTRGDLSHQYTREDVLAIVHCYNRVLTKYLNVTEPHLFCYLMERDCAYLDPKNPAVIKDGIHLMYPNVILSKHHQQILRQLVVKQLVSRLTELTQTTNDHLLDAAITNVSWIVYGCSKPNIKPYLLTAVLDVNGEDISHCVPIEPLDLIKTLSVYHQPQQPSDSSSLLLATTTTVKAEYYDMFDMMQEHLTSANGGKRRSLLPMGPPGGGNNMRDGLSLFNQHHHQDGGGAFSDHHHHEMTGCNDEMNGGNNSNGGNNNRHFYDSNLEDARKLTKLLSSERASSYTSWINVGLCLHAIHYKLLPDWIEFSLKCPSKFQEGKCEESWNGFGIRQDGYTMGTLIHWARQDDPVGFAHYNEHRIEQMIKNAISCSHQDVAKLLYGIYKNQYVSTDSGTRKSDKVWFYFDADRHRWIECDGKVQMKNIMGNSIPDYCLQLKIRLMTRLRSARHDDEKDSWNQLEEGVQRLLIKLKDASFKDKVYSECVWIFNDPDFFKKLDENIDLIGCDNGVFNLKTGEFRAGQPEDYVSMSTGIKYLTEDDEGSYNDPLHSKVKGVNGFFNKIQPNPNVCRYLQHLLGYCLYGRNVHEQFYILEGVGGNGKSKLIELMESALGPYASNIGSNFFTQKRTSSQQANPEIAKIVHARVVTTQEMEESEKMNLATFKTFVGNDTITYRPLFGGCREVRAKFNILMAVNHLPALPGDDVGTWRRIRLIKFSSRFVDNPDPNSEFEHQKDPLLAEKFKQWKEPMLYLLFKWHRQVRQQDGCKLDEPEEVLESTRKYQKQSDQYSEFIEQFTIKKMGGFLSLDELFQRLQEWWETSGNGISGRANKKQFKLILEKRWGQDSIKSRQFGIGWKDYEICDNSGVVNKTTDKDGCIISMFSV